jgi:branched-chain amino acid aminotransferase
MNLTYKDYSMDFDLDTLKVAPALKQHLNDIRVGNVPDKHNWLEKLPS